MSSPLIVLTRPSAKNSVLAQQLHHELQAQTLSAASTHEARQTSAPLQVYSLSALELESQTFDCPSLKDVGLVFFVSSFAVQTFFAGLDRATLQALSALPHLYFGAVGQSSCQALLDWGIDPQRIIQPAAGESDSEGFFAQLQQHSVMTELQQQRRVLIVRGQQGRNWLAKRLLDALIRVDFLVVYQRRPQHWSGDAMQPLLQALQHKQPMIWLITSSESAQAIIHNWRQYGIEDYMWQQQFVVIHERIAECLQQQYRSFCDQKLQLTKDKCNNEMVTSSHDKALQISLCFPEDRAILEAIKKLSRHAPRVIPR
ncbi:uroporphyrinogen-III synthase [Brackiella oedipodis]|uniref:uroporphyrinogen-III synthase n=1 Tax=Brackiella oedipodis TaxID=124225 RepID=UPI00048AD46D|nr:uroporphyrinogen-III synthase [Brackiella oedipodis]